MPHNIGIVDQVIRAMLGLAILAYFLKDEFYFQALGLAGFVGAYLLATARTVLASHWRRRFGQPVTAIDPDRDIADLTEPPGAEPPSDAPIRAQRILHERPARTGVHCG